jgi:hypothetical protein
MGAKHWSVSIATKLRNGRPNNRGSIPGMERDFSPTFKTNCGAHAASYPPSNGEREFFLMRKAASDVSLPLSLVSRQDYVWTPSYVFT